MRFDVTKFVGVCLSCHNWQVDITPRGRSEHGGLNPVMLAAAEVHRVHMWGDCPGGPNSRIRVQGQWVEQPTLPDTGNPATGTLGFNELPRWWVWT